MQNKQFILFEKAAIFYPEWSGVWYGFLFEDYLHLQIVSIEYVGVSVGDELLTSFNNIKLS